MRAVYALIGLCRTYGSDVVEQACAAALELDVISVVKIRSIVEKGTGAQAAQAAARSRQAGAAAVKVLAARSAATRGSSRPDAGPARRTADAAVHFHSFHHARFVSFASFPPVPPCARMAGEDALHDDDHRSAAGHCLPPSPGHAAIPAARTRPGTRAPKPGYCGQEMPEDRDGALALVRHTALTAFRRRQQLAGQPDDGGLPVTAAISRAGAIRDDALSAMGRLGAQLTAALDQLAVLGEQLAAAGPEAAEAQAQMRSAPRPRPSSSTPAPRPPATPPPGTPPDSTPPRPAPPRPRPSPSGNTPPPGSAPRKPRFFRPWALEGERACAPAAELAAARDTASRHEQERQRHDDGTRRAARPARPRRDRPRPRARPPAHTHRPAPRPHPRPGSPGREDRSPPAASRAVTPAGSGRARRPARNRLPTRKGTPS